jgi:hypothetical protein
MVRHNNHFAFSNLDLRIFHLDWGLKLDHFKDFGVGESRDNFQGELSDRGKQATLVLVFL